MVNENSAVSVRIGEYYAQKRSVASSNIIRIRTTTEETIERAAYGSTIEAPIASAIAKEGLQDRILYLVLTKGVPLKLSGTAGPNGTAGSVDSELTLLYRRMTGRNVPAAGRVDNPYFLRTGDPARHAPFTHREHDIYLVTRLDGFTEDDVVGLIDRAAAPSPQGRIVLDGIDPLANRTAEGWLAATAKRLEAQGQASRVLLDATPKPVRNVPFVLGYYSWGSLDPQNRVRDVDLGFAPGAIAASFATSDARTFEPPPDGWAPSGDQKMMHGGTAHSLIGDLVRQGITGASGQVAEPYLQGAMRPDILFPAYLAGANLAEAFYLALPHLGWQTMVVGDPLAAPFRTAALTRAQIEEPVDDGTVLPGLFSRRRVAEVARLTPGAPERAVVLSVRASALLAAGKTAEGRAALEDAVKLAPRVVPWQVQLATLDEAAGRHDVAIGRYREILEIQPDNVAVLNNLAYALAVHQKAAREALPYAKRAAGLAPREPLVLDTLGWIEHLLGNSQEAAKLLAAAAKGAPNHPEVRLHAAIVFAAAGARAVAETELKEALRLDPALASREEVRQLREALGSRN